ncbi:nucleolar protein [Rhizina undulata]
MAPESKLKKRKAAPSAPAPSAKKSKKADSAVQKPSKKESKPTAPSHAKAPEKAAPASKKPDTRKKAVDFYSDESGSGSESEDEGWAGIQEAPKGKKPSAASKDKKKPTAASVLAKKGKKEKAAPELEPEAEEKSDEAEISLDVGDEMPDPDNSEDESAEEEIDDQTATLLKGFESSDDEDEEEGQKFDSKKLQKAGIPDQKKVKKKLDALGSREKATPGIIYLGRIPHGFYEHEMRSYFSQFGTVNRLRLSRNKKTGRSKHYAFLEFADSEVAKIVAETMDSYLLFGHILRCKVVPRDNLADVERLFKGANKRFKPKPGAKLAKAELEKKRTVEQWEKVEQKENKRRKSINKKLKDAGMDYEFDAPEVVKPTKPAKIEEAPKVVEEEKTVEKEVLEKEVVITVEDGIEEVQEMAVVKGKAKKTKKSETVEKAGKKKVVKKTTKKKSAGKA